jgi:AcrR family transcriptional regulator
MAVFNSEKAIREKAIRDKAIRDKAIQDKAIQEKVPSGKRQATRQVLLEAVRDLVFEKGHDSISIQEITTRARVSIGTYYNYFDTKPDAFMAVAQNLQDVIAVELETIREPINDPAMKVAITLKYYFHQSLDNQNWRDFTRFTKLTELPLEQAINARIEDIERGVKGGRFKVDNVHFTESLIRGMFRHVVSAIDKGHVGRNATDYAIRSILQMLGLPEIVAKALTQTPLPPIAAQKRLVSESVNEKVVTSLSEYLGDVPLSR